MKVEYTCPLSLSDDAVLQPSREDLVRSSSLADGVVEAPEPIMHSSEFRTMGPATPRRQWISDVDPMHQAMVTLLPQVTLFSRKSKSLIKDIVDHAQHITFGEGEIILRQNDSFSDSFYVVMEGSACALFTDSSGNARKVATLRRFAHFGLLQLQCSPRAKVGSNVDIVALTVLSCIKLPRFIRDLEFNDLLGHGRPISPTREPSHDEQTVPKGLRMEEEAEDGLQSLLAKQMSIDLGNASSDDAEDEDDNGDGKKEKSKDDGDEDDVFFRTHVFGAVSWRRQVSQDGMLLEDARHRIASCLNKCPVFESLEPAQIATLVPHLEYLHLQERERIVLQGERRSRGLWLVFDGHGWLLPTPDHLTTFPAIG